MRIIPLHITAPRVPDLDRAVFRRRDQPLRLAMECDTRDVRRVAVESENGVRVRRLDVI